MGAGLSGISASYHLGHQNCIIFEKNSFPGGHIRSEILDGFTWDEGPHVSFTKQEYVRELFEKNTEREFLEYPVSTANYYYGKWIPHPAQCNLWAVPQPLREQCLVDFLASRTQMDTQPVNYDEWLKLAFGSTFTEHFPKAYTEKYWTTHPKNLATDWVGDRVFFPKIEDVQHGYLSPLPCETHYITQIRYPKEGGFFRFARKFYEDANLKYQKELVRIDFDSNQIWFSDGTTHHYENLINTLPLPLLVDRSLAPERVKEAARTLRCSSVLLVNVTANHPTTRKENWLYVYDENKYSTRINFTELLSPNNAPIGKTGIQVEVYFSPYRLKTKTDEQIAQLVCNELVVMGLIENQNKITSCYTRWVEWANVIFDHPRREAQNIIFEYLEKYGLVREFDDLSPMTNWTNTKPLKLGRITLAGRYAQWKYFWTDDCVMRGNFIANYAC